MADGRRTSSRNGRKSADITRIMIKEELQARTRQVSEILKKSEEERSEAERGILDQSPDVVKSLKKSKNKRERAKQRVLEVEDPPEVLHEKCKQLADAIENARNVIIYTGAGISTSADIPDYRGPNGVWTLLQQGKQIEALDLSDAEPTVTHMSIVDMYQSGLVKHVVSQNCDGLHIRSGLPRQSLSEVHGNMFIEICNECKPAIEYIRLFDVTEKTGVRKHKTGRTCHKCSNELKDTIVHFGEKGGMGSPYNWEEAAKVADEADMILCLGTSLKILKKYPCLWNMQKPPNKRPNLYIVNLQWTPKDECAVLKINGKCDEVMEKVMDRLGLDIPSYHRENDPIFKLATPLRSHELSSTSKKILDIPSSLQSSINETETARPCENIETVIPVRKVITMYNDNNNQEVEVELQPNIALSEHSITNTVFTTENSNQVVEMLETPEEMAQETYEAVQCIIDTKPEEPNIHISEKTKVNGYPQRPSEKFRLMREMLKRPPIVDPLLNIKIPTAPAVKIRSECQVSDIYLSPVNPLPVVKFDSKDHQNLPSDTHLKGTSNKPLSDQEIMHQEMLKSINALQKSEMNKHMPPNVSSASDYRTLQPPSLLSSGGTMQIAPPSSMPSVNNAHIPGDISDNNHVPENGNGHLPASMQPKTTMDLSQMNNPVGVVQPGNNIPLTGAIPPPGNTVQPTGAMPPPRNTMQQHSGMMYPGTNMYPMGMMHQQSQRMMHPGMFMQQPFRPGQYPMMPMGPMPVMNRPMFYPQQMVGPWMQPQVEEKKKRRRRKKKETTQETGPMDLSTTKPKEIPDEILQLMAIANKPPQSMPSTSSTEQSAVKALSIPVVEQKQTEDTTNAEITQMAPQVPTETMIPTLDTTTSEPTTTATVSSTESINNISVTQGLMSVSCASVNSGQASIPLTNAQEQLAMDTSQAHMPVSTVQAHIPVTSIHAQLPESRAQTQVQVPTVQQTQNPVTSGHVQIPVPTAQTQTLGSNVQVSQTNTPTTTTPTTYPTIRSLLSPVKSSTVWDVKPTERDNHPNLNKKRNKQGGMLPTPNATPQQQMSGAGHMPRMMWPPMVPVQGQMQMPMHPMMGPGPFWPRMQLGQMPGQIPVGQMPGQMPMGKLPPQMPMIPMPNQIPVGQMPGQMPMPQGSDQRSMGPTPSNMQDQIPAGNAPTQMPAVSTQISVTTTTQTTEVSAAQPMQTSVLPAGMQRIPMPMQPMFQNGFMPMGTQYMQQFPHPPMMPYYPRPGIVPGMPVSQDATQLAPNSPVQKRLRMHLNRRQRARKSKSASPDPEDNELLVSNLSEANQKEDNKNKDPIDPSMQREINIPSAEQINQQTSNVIQDQDSAPNIKTVQSPQLRTDSQSLTSATEALIALSRVHVAEAISTTDIDEASETTRVQSDRETQNAVDQLLMVAENEREKEMLNTPSTTVSEENTKHLLVENISENSVSNSPFMGPQLVEKNQPDFAGSFSKVGEVSEESNESQGVVYTQNEMEDLEPEMPDLQQIYPDTQAVDPETVSMDSEMPSLVPETAETDQIKDDKNMIQIPVASETVVASLNTEKEISVMASTEAEDIMSRTSTPSELSQDGSSQGSQEGSDETEAPKKRTSTSVPGWFGKGLSIKKLKRRRLT